MISQNNRSLYNGQQIDFTSIKKDEPDLWKSLKISQVPPTLFPSSKASKEAEENLVNQKLEDYKSMMSKLQNLGKATNNLQASIQEISSKAKEGSTSFESRIKSILSLKNDGIAMGIN